MKSLNTWRWAPVTLAATIALASPAMAQVFGSATYTPDPSDVTQTVTDGNVTHETVGVPGSSPYQDTHTTTTEQTVETDTAPTTVTGYTYTDANGNTHTNGTYTYSGSGEQGQLEIFTEEREWTGSTPTVTSTSTVITPDGSDPVVTAVSFNGTIGDNPDSFSGAIATSGPVDADGNVVATENTVLQNISGVTYSERVGTATYDPITGDVSVTLPSAPTSYTTVSAHGIETNGSIAADAISATSLAADTITAGTISATGAVSAFGFDANGERIQNVGNAIDPTDAVNLGQVQGLVAAGTGALRDLIDENRKRADAGTAVAVALSGGTFLPDKQFNVTLNVGGYRSQAAIAGQIGYLVSENVALNAGVAHGFKKRGGTAWRGGVSFGF